MRFYFGFSKRIPIKIVIAGLIALAILLIGVLGVHADTIGIPSSIEYATINNLVSANVQDSGQGYYYFSISNPGMNSYNFKFQFNANSSLCPSQKAKFTFNFNFNDENNQPDEHLYIESLKYYDNQLISGSLTGGGYKTLTINNLDLTKSFSFIVNETNSDKLIWSAFSPASYECISSESEIIIDNATQNTQDIIDNATQNTQDIIDNQNSNTQAIIDSNKSCFTIDSSFIISNYKFLDSNGVVNDTSFSYFGITDYIDISNSEISILSVPINSGSTNYCFFNNSKSVISCSQINVSSFQVPGNAKYLRTTMMNGVPNFKICKKDSQVISDSLTDDNIGGSLSTGNSFFDNFSIDDSRGFTSIITAPIRLLQTIINSGSSCSDLTIPLNMSDGVFSGSNTLTLPCGQILWSKAPSAIQLLWHTLVYGLLGYRVLVDMVRFINHMLNPEYSTEYLMDL